MQLIWPITLNADAHVFGVSVVHTRFQASRPRSRRRKVDLGIDGVSCTGDQQHVPCRHQRVECAADASQSYGFAPKIVTCWHMPMLSRSLLLRGHRLLLLLTQRRPEFCPPLRHALRLRAFPDRWSLSLMTSATSPWHTRIRACARTFRELEPDEQSPHKDVEELKGTHTTPQPLHQKRMVLFPKLM